MDDNDRRIMLAAASDIRRYGKKAHRLAEALRPLLTVTQALQAKAEDDVTALGRPQRADPAELELLGDISDQLTDVADRVSALYTSLALFTPDIPAESLEAIANPPVFDLDGPEDELPLLPDDDLVGVVGTGPSH